jgi:hypothetical protein
MDWKGFLEVTSPGNFLERRRTMKNGSHDSWYPSWTLNHVPSEYMSEALPYEPTCPMK